MTIQELNKRINIQLSHRIDYNIRSVVSAICANELQLLLSKAELVQDKQFLTYILYQVIRGCFDESKFLFDSDVGLHSFIQHCGLNNIIDNSNYGQGGSPSDPNQPNDPGNPGQDKPPVILDFIIQSYK